MAQPNFRRANDSLIVSGMLMWNWAVDLGAVRRDPDKETKAEYNQHL